MSDTFRVAGTIVEAIGGPFWDPVSDAGLMIVNDEGTHIAEFSGVAPGFYEFKITRNGEWQEGENSNVDVLTDSNVCITYTDGAITTEITPINMPTISQYNIAASLVQQQPTATLVSQEPTAVVSLEALGKRVSQDAISAGVAEAVKQTTTTTPWGDDIVTQTAVVEDVVVSAAEHSETAATLPVTADEDEDEVVEDEDEEETVVVEPKTINNKVQDETVVGVPNAVEPHRETCCLSIFKSFIKSSPIGGANTKVTA